VTRGKLEGAAAVDAENAPIMYRLVQAAKLTGLSDDFLRRSDCPKVILRGTGPKDCRPVIGIMADDLREWLLRHRQG
jgi:hypothetical protein